MTIYLEKASRPAQSVPMTDAEWQARVQLAACYRIFDMLGWVEMIFNHITARVPERIDQEPNLGSGHARRDVVEDHLDPAQHVEDAVAGRELHASLPLGIGHRHRLRRARRLLEIDRHRFSLPG